MWLKRVARITSTCLSRDAAWAWESDGSKVFLLDSNGDQINSWSLSEPLKTVYVNDDCEMAWVTGKDSLKVFAIDRRIRDRVIELPAGQQLHDKAESVCPIQGTRAAWVLAGSDKSQYPVIKLESEGMTLRMVPHPDVKPGFVITDHAHALGAARIWVVPEDKGLYIARDGSFKPVGSLGGVNVLYAYQASDNRFAWVVPDKRGGVYVVDAEGEVLNGGQPILREENVAEVYVSSPTVSDLTWIRNDENRMYVARISAQNRTVEVLNGGRPLTTPSGGPLEIGTLVTPNGSIAWAHPPADNVVSRLFPGIWRLAVAEDGSVSANEVDPRTFESKDIRSLYSDYQHPDTVRVKTEDYSLYEVKVSEKGAESAPLIKRTGCQYLNITSMTPSTVPGRYWVRTDNDSFVMGTADELRTARFKVGGGELNLNSRGRQRLSGHLDSPFEAEVELDWPARATSNGTVTVRVFAPRPDGQRQLVAENMGQLSGGRGRLQLAAGGSVQYSDAYEVELTYLDDLGTKLTVTWPSVTFELTLLEQVLHNKFIKSLLLLLVPTALVLAFFGNRLAVRKWAPALIPVVNILAIKLRPQFFDLGLLDFSISAALLFIFFVVAGLASPWAFQRLASIQPFTFMASVVLMFPRARRHVFRQYVALLRRELLEQRKKANDESYVPLPIHVEAARPLEVSGKSEVLTVERLSQLITTPDPRERAHLVIQGPGGRGKSALLNELLERAADAFEKNPKCPLPVLGDRRFKSLEEMVERALVNVGGSAISGRLLESGNLIVFIDDLGESQVEPSNIEVFVRSAANMTRLCATMRSGPAYVEAINRGDRILVVSPVRLDEANLATFVESYAQSDARRSGTPEGVPAQIPDLGRLAAVCKSPDGSYLPLLIRLAMRANVRGRELTSVSDIYEGSLERLLKKGPNEDEQLWRDVEELACATYWDEHTRLIATNRSKPGEAKLIESLLKDGVLVRGDREESLVRSTPRQVRFFHDSVQSYLAARALGRTPRWDALAETAGEEWFQRARSDIMGGATSELFAMCVEVFSPVDVLRKHLSEQLRDWQMRFHGELTARQVIEAVPVWLQPDVNDMADPLRGSAECLKAAIAVCQKEDEREDSATRLGVLYGRMAPHIWPLIQAADASASEKAA